MSKWELPIGSLCGSPDGVVDEFVADHFLRGEEKWSDGEASRIGAGALVPTQVVGVRLCHVPHNGACGLHNCFFFGVVD